MLDPYRMVVVNVISSCILIVGLLLFKYVYPKKNVPLIVILILISLLPLVSLLRKGSYESGLLSEHVGVAMSFFDTVSEGNILPTWSQKACSGYGCPLFIFHYFLPFSISYVYHLLGFSFLASVKLLLASSFVASGITMYLWMKEEGGKLTGFVSALFFLFAPYHLADLHFRVSIGEILSMALLPIIFLSIKKLSVRFEWRYFFIGLMSTSMIILSHHITLFASLPIVAVYSLICVRKNKSKWEKIIQIGTMLGIGMLLVAYYWIPIVVESKFMRQSLTQGVLFSPFWSYIYSPFEYRFGLLFQGHRGELYPNLGYIHIVVLIMAGILLLKNKINGKIKPFFLSFFLLFIFYFFMTQSISERVWKIIPFLENAGFAWRLMIEVSFITAVIAGLVVKQLNKQWITILLCFFVVWLTILNWGNRRMISEQNDAYFRKVPLYEEAPCRVELSTPIWVDPCAPWIGKYPKEHLQILAGRAEIKEIYRDTMRHEYIVYSKSRATLKENTYYFPGWLMTINGSPSPVRTNVSGFNGLMIFDTEKGLQKVSFHFGDSPIRALAKQVSFVSFCVLFIYVIFWSQILKKLKKLS
ncbi:MAG: 6-pyruvoyl-tetrahydropterin synthase-related protein [bacterium]|nr:6-pyruvoyl-tetrahydropterin synthase-related protein [bacterium]